MKKMPRRELRDRVSKVSRRMDVRAGSPLPLGTQESGGGVNFAIFSRNASSVRLELFDHPKDAAPSRAIDLDSMHNRTGDVWHVWVKGIANGQCYAYRVGGDYEPGKGRRFNFHRLLLDPFATAISQLPRWDFAAARGYDPSSPEQDLAPSKVDNSGSMPKCIFSDAPFEWEGDRLPRHPWSKIVIYEVHVRGFTIHPKSGVAHPGTYRGLMEKIPYLKTLGITAVELMPVQEFNENSVTRINPRTKQALKNYWGYDPVIFCAPKASYSSSGGLGKQKREFKEMVRVFPPILPAARRSRCRFCCISSGGAPGTPSLFLRCASWKQLGSRTIGSNRSAGGWCWRCGVRPWCSWRRRSPGRFLVPPGRRVTGRPWS